MTKNKVLMKIYHKLVTEGECILHNPNNPFHKYVRIMWDVPCYYLYARNNADEKWELRAAEDALDNLSGWLKTLFAEFGREETDAHEVWENAFYFYGEGYNEQTK